MGFEVGRGDAAGGEARVDGEAQGAGVVLGVDAEDFAAAKRGGGDQRCLVGVRVVALRFALGVVGAAEHEAELLPGFEEVLLEQGDDLVDEGLAEALVAGYAHQVGVAEAVVAVEEELDAGVDGFEDGDDEVDEVLLAVEDLGGEGGVEVVADHCGVRGKLGEVKAAAQGGVHERDGAVGGVHGAQDVEVRGDGEALFGVWEAHDELVRCGESLGRLQEGDQLAEDFADVAAVDLVDDEDVVGGVLEAEGDLGALGTADEVILEERYALFDGEGCGGLRGVEFVLESEELEVNGPDQMAVATSSRALGLGDDVGDRGVAVIGVLVAEVVALFPDGAVVAFARPQGGGVWNDFTGLREGEGSKVVLPGRHQSQRVAFVILHDEVLAIFLFGPDLIDQPLPELLEGDLIARDLDALGGGAEGDGLEDARFAAVVDGVVGSVAVGDDGADAFDELLVGKGLVEGDEFDAALAPEAFELRVDLGGREWGVGFEAEGDGAALGAPGFARARGAVEDDVLGLFHGGRGGGFGGGGVGFDLDGEVAVDDGGVAELVEEALVEADEGASPVALIDLARWGVVPLHSHSMSVHGGGGVEVVGADGGADAEDAADALVGDDLVAFGDLGEAPDLVEGVDGEVFVAGEQLVAAGLELLFREAREVAELVPADADVLAGEPGLPLSAALAGGEFPVTYGGVREGVFFDGHKPVAEDVEEVGRVGVLGAVRGVDREGWRELLDEVSEGPVGGGVFEEALPVGALGEEVQDLAGLLVQDPEVVGSQGVEDWRERAGLKPGAQGVFGELATGVAELLGSLHAVLHEVEDQLGDPGPVLGALPPGALELGLDVLVEDGRHVNPAAGLPGVRCVGVGQEPLQHEVRDGLAGVTGGQ